MRHDAKQAAILEAEIQFRQILSLLTIDSDAEHWRKTRLLAERRGDYWVDMVKRHYEELYAEAMKAAPVTNRDKINDFSNTTYKAAIARREKAADQLLEAIEPGETISTQTAGKLIEASSLRAAEILAILVERGAVVRHKRMFKRGTMDGWQRVEN